MCKDNRTISVAALSCLFAYLLSFLFEGQVLYSTVNAFGAQSNSYILVAIVAHFAGLLSCGFFIKTPRMAKSAMVIGMAICLIATAPFLFAPSTLWFVALMAAGYASGCAVAAWGYFLKKFTPRNDRIKSCADVLIFSNIIMIAINVIVINLSHVIGLILSMLCLIKVWVTFKNISNETIESPKAKALYIVYTEGTTGDDSDMKSEENSQVMLEVADRDERYMSRVDLAPGETTGGWMIYQRQADKSEITMHYYSGFVNVPPDLVFKFTVE